MSVPFNLVRDINGYNGFGLPPSTDVFGGTLVANTAQSVTVPNNHQQWLAVFMIEPGDAVWIAKNTTAIVPSGAFGSITCQLNPSAWIVSAYDVTNTTRTTLSFVTADTGDNVGVAFYYLPGAY